MADFQEAFSTVTNTDYLVDMALVSGGFMSGVLMKALVEQRLGRDLPDPIYGVPAAVGGAAMDRMMVSVGGAGYIGVAAAREFGIQDSAVAAIGGAN